MEIVGRCYISGGAHGYVIEGELVQTADGKLLRRSWSDLQAKPDLVEIQRDLDIAAEFARLRTAGPLDRPGHRIARVEVCVGPETIAIDYPRPLIGDELTDHPADRLYHAIFGTH